MNKIGALVEEIEAKLNEHKEYQENYGDVGNREGWIEALEYVLKRIEYIVE
jgi:hypothetical protein